MNNWFDTNDVGRVQIEITNYCNAACPLCERAKLDKSILNNQHLRLEDLEKWFGNSEWKRLEIIDLCGSSDEPTINPEIVEIIKFFQTLNNKVMVTVATNGGTRNEKFWKELGEISSHGRLKVIFGIDGLEDTNHIYRRNVKWEILDRNVKAFISNGGNAAWQFIVFEHNKHQTEEAYHKSKEYGFKNFKLRQSNRSEVKDIVPSTDFKHISNSTSRIKDRCLIKRDSAKVLCSAKVKKGQRRNFHSLLANMYVNFQGYLTPCCWMGTQVGLTELWEYSEIDPKFHSLYHYSIDEIIAGPMWKSINDHLQEYPLCGRKCRG